MQDPNAQGSSTVRQVSVLGNLRVAGALVLDKDETAFPSNPKPGTLLMKGGSLYAYTTINGVMTWFPLFRNLSNAYLHTQVNLSASWVVNHQLASKHYWFQIQDDNGDTLYESARADSNNDNTTTLSFSEPVSGTVIFVGPNDIVLSNINASLVQVGNVEITTNSVKINGVDVLTSNMVDAVVAAATAGIQTTVEAFASAGDQNVLSSIQGGVVAAGDNLNKLYTLIQAIETTLQSDDVSLDTIQEFVTRIKSDEGLLASLTTGKVNVSDLTTALALKANVSDVNSELALKANLTDLSDKVTTTQLNTAVSPKANTTDVNTALALKANVSDLASKVNFSDIINALTSTSGTVPLSAAQGKVLNDKITVLQQGEVINALGNVSGAKAIDMSAGTYVTMTITAAATLSISNVPDATHAYGLTLEITNGGSNITWPGSITWLGAGTAPTLKTAGVNLITLVTRNGGTSWFGNAS